MSCNRTQKGAIPLITLLASITLLSLLSSCQSRYIIMNYEHIHPAVWNEARTDIVFLGKAEAYIKREGIIVNNPVRGRGRTLYEEVSLYLFNVEEKRLTRLLCVEGAEGYQFRGVRWVPKLLYTDSLIYYSLTPSMGWDWLIERSNQRPQDSLRMVAMRDQFYGVHGINPDEMTSRRIEGVTDIAAIAGVDTLAENSVNNAELRSMLTEVPMADWGLIAIDIYPHGKNQLIDEVIYNEKHSAVMKRAVFEQLIAPMEPAEIQKLIDKMDRYKARLEENKKGFYETRTRALYQKLHDLLKQ